MITQENIPYTVDEIKAMVKTIEELRKKYNGAFERAKCYHKSLLQEKITDCGLVNELEYIFPELKESEDEQSRKWILEYLYDGLRKADEQFKGQFKTAIAWLEEQGEQKQTWKPSAAQLIVIKDLIEDKNTSNLNKAILRNMLTEFKRDFGLC